MMNKKLYKLTPKHKKILETWSKQWIDNALSTKAMDNEEKDICRKNVRKMYKIAGLIPPKNIVFVPSPFVLRFAGGLAEAIWDKRKYKNSETRSTTRLATDSATRSATGSETNLITNSSTDTLTNPATPSSTSSHTS